jgi:hypothetical protein
VRLGERPGMLLLALGSLLGCATTSPSPEAQRVIPVSGVPGPLCQNLGTVIGEAEVSGRGASSATPEELSSQANRRRDGACGAPRGDPHLPLPGDVAAEGRRRVRGHDDRRGVSLSGGPALNLGPSEPGSGVLLTRPCRAASPSGGHTAR